MRRVRRVRLRLVGLEPLLGTFRHHPRTGLAAAKVLGPDGRLREAGGIVLPDGHRRRTGWGGGPDAPPHNHVKRVDFCSPALLATPRRVLEELGGLAEVFRDPALVFVDYCLRLRQRGLEVRVQPRAVAVCISAEDLLETVRGDAADEAAFQRRWGSTADLAWRGECLGGSSMKPCSNKFRLPSS